MKLKSDAMQLKTKPDAFNLLQLSCFELAMMKRHVQRLNCVLLCFCFSTDPVLQIAVSNKLVGLEQAVSEYAHNITSAIAAK